MPRSPAVFRVGATVVVGLVLLGAGIFFIGEKDLLFTSRSSYFIQFDAVAGLTVGNPVQLSGVLVGTVDDIVLPQDAGDTQLAVWISIDRRYAERIRQDTLARIQTLGLLGDKYIALSSGSSNFAVIPDGGEITAAEVTDMDTLLASGGDAVDNLVLTASSLSKILARMERGEGVVGQLMSDRGGENVLENFDRTLASLERIAQSIDQGDGALSRLIHDPDMADNLGESVERLGGILEHVEEGEGLVPGLLGDKELRARFEMALDNLESTSRNLAALTAELESGDGLLPRLFNDEELADEITGDLRQLLDRFNSVAEKLDEGEGTAAQLLNDPAVFDALDDILVGINESKFLRWIIRNRQKKGIKKRYEEEQGALEESAEESVAR